MNPNATIRTPYHQLAISLTLKSIDRKLYRDQYCMECGRPFMAISDKFVAIYDGAAPIDTLRSDTKIIEARCKNHACKQYYRIEV